MLAARGCGRIAENCGRQCCQIAKFDPFLSLDCAPTPSTLAQSKERKGSNFVIYLATMKGKGSNGYDNKRSAHSFPQCARTRVLRAISLSLVLSQIRICRYKAPVSHGIFSSAPKPNMRASSVAKLVSYVPGSGNVRNLLQGPVFKIGLKLNHQVNNFKKRTI